MADIYYICVTESSRKVHTHITRHLHETAHHHLAHNLYTDDMAKAHISNAFDTISTNTCSRPTHCKWHQHVFCCYQNGELAPQKNRHAACRFYYIYMQLAIASGGEKQSGLTKWHPANTFEESVAHLIARQQSQVLIYGWYT